MAVLFLVTSVAVVAGITRMSKPTRSPAPQIFDLGIDEAYQRILKLLSKEHVGAHHWTIEEAIDNACIITRLEYSETEALRLLNCNGVFNFDFKKIGDTQTMVRWFCTWDSWCDSAAIAKVEKLSDSWIKTALSDPGHTIAPIILNTEVDSKLNPDMAFKRLLQRLSTSNDSTSKWVVHDYEKPSTILAKLDHLDLHKKQVRCSAEIKFAFNTNGIKTKLICTYTIDPKYSMEKIQPFKQLTDDWIQMVLWSA